MSLNRNRRWRSNGPEDNYDVAPNPLSSSFVPIPGDAYVAGGALDQFGSVKVGIEYGK